MPAPPAPQPGLATRLAPRTRLLCGGLALGALLLAPPSGPGWGLQGAALGAWVWLCRPPWRRLALAQGVLLLGLAPTLALLAAVQVWGTQAAPLHDAAAAGLRVLVRAAGVSLISLATLACLPQRDLEQALRALPLPWVVAALLLQILQQLGHLRRETRRMADAMALRGASGAGRAAWRVAWALPRVWLPRVLARTERVADALELRGALAPLPSPRVPLGRADGLALGLGCALAALALALRVQEHLP